MPEPPLSLAKTGRRPTVLAIDTTAGLCSVAVDGPEGSARCAVAMTHGHSRQVLGLVEAVLAQARIAPSAIEVVGFGSGPGSFTGLRIACGIAQGLGFGWGCPLVPVDAMRTLALQARAALGVSHDAVLVALDLRMGEACIAAFTADALGEAWPRPAFGPVLATPQAACSAFAAFGARSPVLAGDGWDAHPALRDAVPTQALRPPGAVQPDAVAVARLAADAWAAGLALPPERAAPTYLRDKVALDVDEQAALRASRAAGAVR